SSKLWRFVNYTKNKALFGITVYVKLWRVMKKQGQNRLGTPHFSAARLLGTPTFKLACLKDKTGFTQRAQRTQRKDFCERPGNAWEWRSRQNIKPMPR
ncbi:MAG TPA: hypothetical protein PK291_07775, partial [Thermotogota bacterium]|nr:hypothetical protein [Thermotogota bacterium]